MKQFLFIAVCLTVAPALVSAQTPTGTITGTIRYTGIIPPSQRITLTDGQILIHNDVVVHKKSKGLRDAAVLLDWTGKVPVNPKLKPVLIDQRDMVFLPRVVTIQQGRKVRFENNDIFNHGVSAQSILGENSFNLTTPPGRGFEHTFKAQANPIPIGCVLHSWMRAYVIVRPHPYHAVTDADGTFRIANVPAGKHTLWLLHPDTNYRETIMVNVIGNKTVDLAITWGKLKK
ncbi:MAG: hypothetical protein HYX68_22850 [Planctomycetes bacterium]|nr:hypothetical protein [Planctomycetota bacterium]